MRFSDSTQFHIPKPIKYANSDSSPFNSDESASDDESPRKLITPLTTSHYDCPTSSSNDNSPIKLYDNSPIKLYDNSPIKLYDNSPIKLYDNSPFNQIFNRSQDQSNLLPPPTDRTTKTLYTLRHQPQKDYRLFIPPSRLYE